MNSRLPLVFVFVTLMIDAMGVGLILPVMPDLLREINGSGLGQAAVWGGILASAFAVMQFLFGPLLGNLSDAYGRRPVLLLSLAVMMADYVVMSVTGSIWVLLIARLVGGITSATYPTAAAFVADISAPEEKTARFGLLGAAFGAGFVLGPLIGGLLSEFGTRAPFIAAAALVGLNLALGFFVFPETVTDATRRRFSLRDSSPFAALKNLSKLPFVGRLILVSFLYELAAIVYPAIWAFYGQAGFGWSPGMIGVSLAAFGVSVVVVQVGLIRLLLRLFPERKIVLIGLAFEMLSLITLGLVSNGNVILAIIPIAAVGAVISPALQTMMSRRVSADRQGELQGVLASARALAAIISPLVMTQMFFAFTAPGAPIYLPGAPFLLALVLIVVCGIVFVATPRAEAGTGGGD